MAHVGKRRGHLNRVEEQNTGKNLPASIVMSPEDMVDAALVGLDQGELVTIPSLQDGEEWTRFEAARRAISQRFGHSMPAPRYGIRVPASAYSNATSSGRVDLAGEARDRPGSREDGAVALRERKIGERCIAPKRGRSPRTATKCQLRSPLSAQARSIPA